jgi:hypothetical protein
MAAATIRGRTDLFICSLLSRQLDDSIEIVGPVRIESLGDGALEGQALPHWKIENIAYPLIHA